jgi:hypothetical protein
MAVLTEKQKIAQLRAQGKSERWIENYMRGWREASVRMREQKKGKGQ